MTNFYLVIKTVSANTIFDLYCLHHSADGGEWKVNEGEIETGTVMATDDFLSFLIRLQNGQTESVIHTASDPLAVKSLKALAPSPLFKLLDGWIGAHGG